MSFSALDSTDFLGFGFITYFREMVETWSNHTQTSFPMAHFSTKHHAITLQAYQSKVESSKRLLLSWEDWQGN